MPQFEYRGRNRRGEAVTGRIEGLTAEAVATQLFNSGITPIDIHAPKAGGDVFGALRLQLGSGAVSLLDLILFCRQMYSLLHAGVPIMQALRSLRESAHNANLVRVIGSVIEGLDAGLDLTSAIRRHSPEVFSPLVVSLVQVGETTGNLPEAFQQLAIYLDRERDTRDRIKQALRYPAIVVVALTIAMAVINLLVIPTFANVYSGLKVQLPLPTQILIATSNFTVAYWYIIALALAALAIGLRLYVATPEGRYHWHKLKLKIPVIGAILYRASLARFSRALAVTMRAGVPIVSGISVVARAVDNDFVADRLLQMRDGISRGESITRTAAATGLFPQLVLQMISVGEESGSLDDLMIEVSDYYDREVDYAIKNLSAAIEPLLLVAVGAMVLVLALGVFLPMWDLIGAFRGR